MSLSLILAFLQALSGGIILFCALNEINGMGPGTRHGVRVAFIFLAAGAFGHAVDPFLPQSADSAPLLSVGLALLFLFDRRRSRGEDRNNPRQFTYWRERREK